MTETEQSLTTSQVWSDIKAETVAASLIESNAYTIEQVVINPVGGSLRTVRKDIEQIHKGKKLLADLDKEKEPKNLVFLDVSRAGVYDYLPEGFFHQSTPSKGKKTTDDSLDEMKEIRTQEKAARLFFLTLEKEINRSRIQMEIEERKSMLGFSEHYKADLFLRIWPQLQGIEQRILVIVFQLLPLSHIISNDLNLLSLVVEAVCGKSVSTHVNRDPRTVKLGTLRSDVLGENWVGLNHTLGTTLTDYDPRVEITISEIRRTEFKRYLTGGDLHKVISLLIEFFVPAFSETKLNLELVDFEEELILDDGDMESYLSYNSCI